MGLRAYTVIKYEKSYGDCLGFNYDFEGFCEFLHKLDLEFYTDDSGLLVELNADELLALNPSNLELDKEELELLLTLQENAKVASYAKNGYFRIEWL